MRFRTFAMATLAISAVVPAAPANAYEMPYDPYPWCAVYSGDAGGASNCGFSTLAQCRATVSGIGGSANPINSIIRAAMPNARASRKCVSLH